MKPTKQPVYLDEHIRTFQCLHGTNQTTTVFTETNLKNFRSLNGFDMEQPLTSKIKQPNISQKIQSPIDQTKQPYNPKICTNTQTEKKIH